MASFCKNKREYESNIVKAKKWVKKNSNQSHQLSPYRVPFSITSLSTHRSAFFYYFKAAITSSFRRRLTSTLVLSFKMTNPS